MTPDLGDLAITDMGRQDRVVFQLPARPLGGDREQRDSVLVAGNDVMQLDLERPPGQLKKPPEELKHVSRAFVVTGGSSARGAYTYAKTRERRRGSGVPEIATKAPLDVPADCRPGSPEVCPP